MWPSDHWFELKLGQQGEYKCSKGLLITVKYDRDHVKVIADLEREKDTKDIDEVQLNVQMFKAQGHSNQGNKISIQAFELGSNEDDDAMVPNITKFGKKK